MKTILANTAAVALLCLPFWGQQASSRRSNPPNAELEQHIRELVDRVIALEGKIRTMESEKAAAAQPQAAPSTAQPWCARDGAQPPGRGAARWAGRRT